MKTERGKRLRVRTYFNENAVQHWRYEGAVTVMSESPVTRDGTSEKLSDLDRKRLRSLVTDAIKECFPPTERIGGTHQRNFYFRKLLQKLCENVSSYGMPVVGGLHVEVHRFLASLEPEWRRNPHYRPGRSGYKLSTMKGLASHWKESVQRYERTRRSIRGNVSFYFRQGTAAEPDLVLGAEVTNFVTSTGTRIDIPRTTSELPPNVRLAYPSPPEEAHDAAKAAVIDKHVRRALGIKSPFAHRYRQNLGLRSLDEISAHIRQFNRLLSDDDSRAAWLLITFVLLGSLWFSIISKNDFTPVFTLSPDGGKLENVMTNEFGQFAEIAEDGRRVSEWTNAIKNPETGSFLAMRCNGDGPCFYQWSGPCKVSTPIPAKWREQSDIPLQTELVWGMMPCDDRTIIVRVFLDIRRFLPIQASEPDKPPPFSLQITPGPHAAELQDVIKLTRDGTHLLFDWHYRFEGDGEYDLYLVYFRKVSNTSASTVQPPDFVALRLLSITTSANAPPVAEVSTPNWPSFALTTICHGSLYDMPQVFIDKDPDMDAGPVIEIVPPPSWPPVSELATTTYAIQAETMWIPQEHIKIQRKGPNYRLAFALPSSDDREWKIQLMGEYRGKRLISPPKFVVKVEHGVGRFIGTYGCESNISSCGSLVWGQCLPGSLMTPKPVS